MKLRPEEITSILKQRIEEYDVVTDLAEVGTVTTALRRVNGQPTSAWWRPRRRLRGTFVLLARAWDLYGNASARSVSTVRLR